jgi:hypothetical protein
MPGSRFCPDRSEEAALPPSPAPERASLLARLDALTDLAHHRHGLLLGPDGSLARTDAAAAAHAIGIEPGNDRGVELLLLLGVAVGVLCADGPRTIRASPSTAVCRNSVC